MWGIVLSVIAAGVALVVLVAATGVVQRLFTDDCEKAYGSGWMTAYPSDDSGPWCTQPATGDQAPYPG